MSGGKHQKILFRKQPADRNDNRSESIHREATPGGISRLFSFRCKG